MGTKFANLQVYDFSVCESQKLLPGSTANQFSKEWTTIVRDDFDFGTIVQEGRRLSKNIDKLVMSVGYFDDDILTLNIFRNGKSIASHISGTAYGYTKKLGNPVTFVHELKLDESCKDYLKWIFKCEDLCKQVELLEKLLGIPLWIDYRMLEETLVDNFYNICDIDYVKHYVNEINKSEKIKNLTKATLISEFEGMFVAKTNHGCFLINHPSDDGKYYGHTARLYTILPSGVPTKLFDDITISFENDSRLLANENLVAVYEDSKYINNIRDSNSFLSVYKNNGEVVGRLCFPEGSGFPLLLFPDGSTIFLNYGSDQVITKYNINGTKQWELYVGYLHVNPIFIDGFIFLHYESIENNKAEIIKVNQEGVIEARYELMPSGSCHWEKFLFDEGKNMYYCCSIKSGDTKLFCFDNCLNKISDYNLREVSFEGLIDIEHNRIFTLLYDKELLTIDLNLLQINEQRKYDVSSHLLYVDNHGYLVVQKGSSTIETFNTNLKIVSRNRFKGDIYSYYKNSSGNLCIITGNCEDYEYGKADRSLIRVYEMEYL